MPGLRVPKNELGLPQMVLPDVELKPVQVAQVFTVNVDVDSFALEHLVIRARRLCLEA